MARNNGAIRLVAGNSNRSLSEAIAAYLATPLAKAGYAFVTSRNCSACHAIAGTPASATFGPDLTHIASRLYAQGIARTLVNPTAPMPSFKELPPEKFKNIVTFLSQLK